MLNPEHWDLLTGARSLFLSRRYLSLLHQHAPPGVRLHAALVYRDGRPVAAVAAQSIRVREEHLPKSERATRKRERTWWKAVGGLDQRVLIGCAASRSAARRSSRRRASVPRRAACAAS